MSKQNNFSSNTSSQEWVYRQSKTRGNKPYYFNIKTGISSWTKPFGYFKDDKQDMSSSLTLPATQQTSNKKYSSTKKIEDYSLHKLKKTKLKVSKSPKGRLKNAAQQEKLHHEQPSKITEPVSVKNIVKPDLVIDTPLTTGKARNRRKRKNKNKTEDNVPDEKNVSNTAIVSPSTSREQKNAGGANKNYNVHQLKVMEMLERNKTKKKTDKVKKTTQSDVDKLKESNPSVKSVPTNVASAKKPLNIHQKSVLQKLQNSKVSFKVSPRLDLATTTEKPTKVMPSRSPKTRSVRQNKQEIVNNDAAVKSWKKLPSPAPSLSATDSMPTLKGSNNDVTPIQEKSKSRIRLASQSKTCQKNIAEKRLKQLRQRLSLTEFVIPKKNNTSEDDASKATKPNQQIKDSDLKSLDTEMSPTKEVETLSNVSECQIQDTFKRNAYQFDVNSTINQNNNSFNPNESNISVEEEMDWETVVAEINQARTDIQPTTVLASHPNLPYESNSRLNQSIADKKTYVVVDTNIFISHLNTLQMLSDSTLTVYNHQNLVIMVPWRVLSELDHLKSSSGARSLNIEHLARKALKYLNNNLSSNQKVQGQSVKDANDHKFPCLLPDDDILNCCLQLADKGEEVILLSNDINLCNKGIVNNLKTFTHTAFISQIDSKTLSSTLSDELSRQIASIAIEKLLNDLLSEILEKEMIRQYEKLWRKIVLIEPPWSLSNTLECILKHWIAVFNDVLLSDAKKTLQELQNFFPPRRKGKEFSKEDIQNVAELGIALSKSCQLNSYYTVSAKECAKKIAEVLLDMNSLKEKSETDDSEKTAALNPILEVFKIIWNGFSIFCGKLASGLGVPHTLQINIDTPVELNKMISEANAVNNQLILVSDCMKSVLRCIDVSSENIWLDKNEACRSLYDILVDTVRGMGHNEVTFDQNQILQFCLKNREVIKNGSNDFMMLHALLEECSVKYNMCHFNQ